MLVLLILATIAVAGAVITVIKTSELKEIRQGIIQELIKTEAKISATIDHNYKQVSYDIAGMTSEMRTFENNKMLQLKTYISKEIETVNRQNTRMENLMLELDKQSADNLEQFKKGLSVEVKTEALNIFNHFMLWERLNRLKEMDKIKKGALR